MACARVYDCSVAHFFGAHTFDDERTPRDHFVTALVTLGEGYHNFHHEYPYGAAGGAGRACRLSRR
jgi:fatty-acid desaturase